MPKRRCKEVRFGGTIVIAMFISMTGAIAVAGLALLSFFFSPQLSELGVPMAPLTLPAIIILIGFLSVKYILPLFVRLRCPKCNNKSLRYNYNLNLSFHCDHCGIEKATWFHIG